MSCSKFAHLSMERCVSCKMLVFGSWKISCVSRLDLEGSDCGSDFKHHLEHQPLCTTHCRLPKTTSDLTSIDGVHWRGHGTNADANHSANICAVGHGAPRYDGLIMFNLVSNCKRSVLKYFHVHLASQDFKNVALRIQVYSTKWTWKIQPCLVDSTQVTVVFTEPVLGARSPSQWCTKDSSICGGISVSNLHSRIYEQFASVSCMPVHYSLRMRRDIWTSHIR